MLSSAIRSACRSNLKRSFLSIKFEHTKAIQKPEQITCNNVEQNTKILLASNGTEEAKNIDVLDTRNLPNEDYVDVEFEKESVLDKYNENISHVAPYLKPTFNFAAYVNKSESLQQLLKLGIKLHKLEKDPKIFNFILSLDFEKDVKNHVMFLCNLGIEIDNVAEIITRNPYILKENIEDLEVRVNYLQYKRFTNEMILRILSKNVFWLSFSTQDIDEKLGFFQKEFSLTGNEVRQVASKQPNLITYDLKKVKVNKFALHEEMGFTLDEMKTILLDKPKLFMKHNNKLLNTFDYLHNTMKIPLELMAKFPLVLSCRVHRLKQRYMFLEKLGKIQFDPKLPNYIALTSIVFGDDSEFCSEVAKTSVDAYNIFLKSL